MTPVETLFAEALQNVLNGEFSDAVACYTELQRMGNHAAVTHNKGLACMLDGRPEEAMKELDANMKAYERYTRSWVLAAELHRLAGGRHLVEGSRLIKHALEFDRHDPQSCIVAAAIMNACAGCRQEAITWHINALAAIKARNSKLSAQFAKVFVDDLKDQALHYFNMPPEEAVATGGLPITAREEGRCLAIVSDGEVPGPWKDWPQVRVTFGAGPRKTEPGQLHVRTQHRWAARFQAARALLDIDIPTAVVWDSDADPDTRILDSQALITRNHNLTMFCLKPASVQELCILRQLFHPQNVPPSTTPEEMDSMAKDVFEFLAKDSRLDVDVVPEATGQLP